jgi:hypothetical protein
MIAGFEVTQGRLSKLPNGHDRVSIAWAVPGAESSLQIVQLGLLR